ncbi:unnamed protein product [Lactuca virosa]|uniref:Endoplasmic reticulum transmembrane protein n=1 Tax=Lactuca virosa TaxID=75947 RepID=A0AAU9PLH4_9ASTR|nr:unnamed protein product [Lactuca virosa]
MISVLYTLLFVEMTTILLLLFKTPLRELLIVGLDQLKRGRAPLIVKSVGATVFTIMIYEIYNISDTRSRPMDTVGPTDQIILAYQMLEASLIGVSIFLLLIIDRIHYYIRELRTLRNTLEAGKKQDGSKNNGAAEVKALNEEIHKLRTKITKLESESGKKGNEIKSTESDSGVPRNQSEATGGKKDI